MRGYVCKNDGRQTPSMCLTMYLSVLYVNLTMDNAEQGLLFPEALTEDSGVHEAGGGQSIQNWSLGSHTQLSTSTQPSTVRSFRLVLLTEKCVCVSQSRILNTCSFAAA